MGLIEQARRALKEAETQEGECQNKFRECNDELRAVRRRIGDLRERIKMAFDKEVGTLSEELFGMRREEEALSLQYEGLRARLGEAERRTREKREALDKLEREERYLRNVVLPEQRGVIEKRKRLLAEAQQGVEAAETSVKEAERVLATHEARLRELMGESSVKAR